MKTHQITGHIGAEISEVDLSDLYDGQIASIKQAWLDYKVLVFREQNITREQHIAFGRNFEADLYVSEISFQ